jgi:hypothetical protein
MAGNDYKLPIHRNLLDTVRAGIASPFGLAVPYPLFLIQALKKAVPFNVDFGKPLIKLENTYARFDFGDDVDGLPLVYSLNVTQSNNFARTNLPGRKGSIKEGIAQNDFTISIQGNIVNTKSFPAEAYGSLNKYSGAVDIYDEQPPLTTIAALKKLADLKAPLKVINPFLNQAYGIYYIMFEQVFYTIEAESYSVVPYSINAVSDFGPNDKLEIK